MKKIVVLTAVVFIFFVFVQALLIPEKMNYKCLIQLKNYGGEGAYVIVSVIKPNGEYDQTLSIHGDDEEWYQDLPDWFVFYETNSHALDGITGASIQSGGRKIAFLAVDPSKLNAGYKLRFETSVEDGKYFKKDVEIDLTDGIAGEKISGEDGYIRYIRIIEN